MRNGKEEDDNEKLGVEHGDVFVVCQLGGWCPREDSALSYISPVLELLHARSSPRYIASSQNSQNRNMDFLSRWSLHMHCC
jgi:hypothetical protein